MWWDRGWQIALSAGGAALLVGVVAPLLYGQALARALEQDRDAWIVRTMGTSFTQFVLRHVNRILMTVRGTTWVFDREAERAQQRSAHAPAGAVLFYGDSEFTFWNHLSEDLAAWRPDCINVAFGGSRTTDLVRHADALVVQRAPEVVVVHCGGNDYDFATLGCLSLTEVCEEAARVLLQLFALLEQTSSVRRVVYFLSARVPFDTDVKKQWDAELAARVMAQLPSKVRVLDFRGMTFDVPGHFCVDQIHLNRTGHAVKAQAFVQRIKGALD